MRDTEAIGRLGELMEQYPLHVLDTLLLPTPKPQLKAMLKKFWRAASPAQKQALEVGYVSLANFQDGVGSKPISLTLSDDSMDTAIALMKRTSEERALLFEEFVAFKQGHVAGEIQRLLALIGLDSPPRRPRPLSGAFSFAQRACRGCPAR